VSLLLEALKKAELAKQQGTASQPGEGSPLPDHAGSGLTLEPGPGPQTRPPLITRDRLPDITQPLEILSEDLPSAGARREPTPAEAGGAPAVAPAPVNLRASADASERATQVAAEQEERDRLSARQLFEAKDVEYNPRRPFFIAVGAVGVLTLAVVGYFVYQMYAPRPSFYAGPPGTTPPQPIAAAAAPAPEPAAPAPEAARSTPIAAAPAAAAAPAETGAPTPPQPVPATGAARPTPPAPAAAGPGRRTPPSGEAPGDAPRGASASPSIKVTAPTPRIEPGLERGWQALQAGDLAAAKEEYLRVLRANPFDRDALLGLATIDGRNQDFDSAEARYLRVLELDPRDPYAQAGIIALRGRTDPMQSESRLKNLLAQQPDSTVLQYALGNLYAVQARWSDAQSAYFKAFSADPENPDYVYNLAVSLDQLHQEKLALEYYRRALALAGNRAVGFNSAQVEARIRELTR
jgi:Flp pilus assembly protein TadD